MATWQDGPEYAPLVPPSGYEPVVRVTPDTDRAPEDSQDTAQSRSARAPLAQPEFTSPTGAVPLGSVTSEPAGQRDPHRPFDVVSRTTTGRSPWQAVHAVPSPPPAAPPAVAPWTAGPPAAAPAAAPAPPAPPFFPSPSGPYAAPTPHDPGTPYGAVAPPSPAPMAGGADLEVRDRGARWLLVPAALFFLGAWIGPLVIVTVAFAAVLLVTRPEVRPAARMVSRIVLGLLTGVLLVSLLAGDGWVGAAGVVRGVGLVYSFLCVFWFVRERSEIDAERRRRAQQASQWPPPPPESPSWPGPGSPPPQGRL